AEKIEQHPTCGRCKAALPVEGAPLHLDDASLERLIRSSPVPVLVDFYADWCGPCRALAPILEQLSRRYAGQLFVVKIDTVAHKRTAGSLGVQGIPAMFLFRGGELVDKATGLRPLGAIEEMIRPHLAA
ncbi:MAG TPA: thiol reductase thioredoxin, partial [Deltaproteobacteria bacterium]|nr:thiol reductase thioredoxin [Deltaproteobacteria bacterium]